MILSFTDGTTTISFGYTSSYNLLRRFTPQVPEISSIGTEQPLEDGGDIYAATYRNVVESADVTWQGSTYGGLADQRSDINILNRMFQQARHRQRTGLGARVYVQFQPVAGDDVYRSEVLSGRVLIDDSYRLGLQLSGQELQSTIVFTRRYYWEGPEAQIPLTNGNGTDDLDGLTVYNCDDDLGEYAERDNWVAIKGEDIEGDLPAPIRLEMENTYDDVVAHTNLFCLWISHNLSSDPENLGHIIEGEDDELGYGTTRADSDSSGGYYQEYSLSSEGWYPAFMWTLSSALLTQCAGNYFKILARFGYDIDVRTLRFKLRLTYQSSVAVIWDSGEIIPDQNVATVIRDLATLQLPPWSSDSGESVPLSLYFYVRNPTYPSGMTYVALDFLQLSPVDNFSMLRSIVYGCAYGETLVFDGIEDALYVDTGSGSAGTFARYGSRAIMLWPGCDQRLYFLQHSTLADSAPVDRTLSVKAYYRPRRLSL